MVSIIVAMTKNRVIGDKGQLPWNIPEDRKLFKSIVLNHPVIMGRKTYFSIPDKFRPIPNRINIVVTSKEFSEERVFFVHSIQEAIKKADSYKKEIFIIGGSGMYEHFLPIVDYLHISHIKKDYSGDTYFPEINYDEWEIVEEKDFEEFVYRKYKRN